VLSDAGLLDKPNTVFRKGAGCQDCHNSGYRGRAGIYVVMEVTSALQRLIHKAAPTHEIQEELRKNGFLTLREEGVLLALDGKTSLEEALAVTHSQDTTNDRGQKTDDRRRRTEDRRQKIEDRGHRTEDRGQKTEDRR